MRVQEEIIVKSTGEQIRHGIYREFPTTYIYKGRKFKVKLKVLEVLRNDNPEEWSVEELQNGVRVYIGDEDDLLEPGIHTYRIVYESKGQIGFFEEHDELYWNANVTGWTIPINRLEVAISLPKEVPKNKIRYEAYTGKPGEAGKDYVAWMDWMDDGVRVHFQTTRALLPGENLTITVVWPRGYIGKSGIIQKIQRLIVREILRLVWEILRLFDIGLYALIQDALRYRHVIALLLTLAIIFLYYLSVRLLMGKNLPERMGVETPEYYPPNGMSPAEVRYVYKRGCDPTCFTVALIDMAVKRALKIKKEKGDYLLEKIPTDGRDLAEDERVLYNALPSKLIVREGPYSFWLRDIQEHLRGALSSKLGYLFNDNLGLLILGFLISALGIIVTRLLEFSEHALILSRELLLFMLGLFYVLIALSGVVRVMALLLMAVAFLPISLLFGSGNPVRDAIVLLSLLSLLILHIQLAKYVRTPTREGQEMMNKFARFRTFLETADKDVLRTLFPGDNLTQIYERLLPYALALDLGETWFNRFAKDLKALGYRPQWYEDPYYVRISTSQARANDIRDVILGLTSAITSATEHAEESP